MGYLENKSNFVSYKTKLTAAQVQNMGSSFITLNGCPFSDINNIFFVPMYCIGIQINNNVLFDFGANAHPSISDANGNPIFYFRTLINNWNNNFINNAIFIQNPHSFGANYTSSFSNYDNTQSFTLSTFDTTDATQGDGEIIINICGFLQKLI